MALAKCKKCGHMFRWYAGRGRRVKDERCPKCGSSDIKGGIGINEYVSGL